MYQSSSLPEIRLVCLIPPDRVQAIPASAKQKRLEEFKVFLCSICQSTTYQLGEQELEHFLEWSGLPWYVIQLSHMKWYEEYIIDAIEQYKQFVKNNPQTEGFEFKAPSDSTETTSLPISSDLENLPQTLEELQSSSLEEDPVALAKELMVQLQTVMPLLERWHKHLEDNKDKALFGELHPYPKNGKLWWNYYPREVDANSERKDKRRYVRQKEVDAYRRAISVGKQLKQIQPLEKQLATFVDAMRLLL